MNLSLQYFIQLIGREKRDTRGEGGKGHKWEKSDTK
jgi:hypothetical protein